METTQTPAPNVESRRPGWWLSCPACGTGLPIGMYNDGCPACHANGKVEALHVDYEPIAPYPKTNRRGVGIWETWGDWLPGAPNEHRLTLGEGNTPLLRVEALCELTGCRNLYLKMEPQNPTGAHKDRFHAVNVAMAKALGMRGVVALSTGNHGLSMSAYAAAHGLKAVVIANERMPLLLQRAIRFAGGLPLLAPPALAEEIGTSLVETGDWLPAMTAWPMPTANPYGIEGYKTIAFEIFRDLGERLPDRIFIPTAGGDLLTGISFGHRDLAQAGFSLSGGRLFACQPAGAAPLVAAFEGGLDEVPYINGAHSIALSIADPITGRNALDAVRASGGGAVAVSDEEILDAGQLLARCGLFIEPSSAAPVAAVRKMAAADPSMRDETIVCVLTSSALKWLEDYGAVSAKVGIAPGSVSNAFKMVEAHFPG